MALADLADRLSTPTQARVARTMARASDQARRQRDHAGAAQRSAAAAATPAANETSAEPARRGVADAILGSAPVQAVGRGFNFMTSVEMALSAKLAELIPFPAMPAVTMSAAGFGMPHAHAHPPNLIPPAAPIPFPHLTSLVAIPVLSGAANTMVGGKPAARCGDMALSVWCGGYLPLCEVFLGSLTVWIEGARAARVGVDITKHCIFTTPKPSDPPIGPMVGMTVEPERSVVIGGVPTPSLTSMAMGQAFKALFGSIGALGRAAGKTRGARVMRALVLEVRGRRYVDRLLAARVVVLQGDAAFNRAALRDLRRLAGGPAGRELFDDLARSGRHVDLHPPAFDAVLFPPPPHGMGTGFDGPYQIPHLSQFRNAHLDVLPDPNGAFLQTLDAQGNRVHQPVTVMGVGKGADSHIVYDPTGTHPFHGATPGSPSHVILGHELNHARNSALGRRANELTMHDPQWQQAWRNLEEHDTVGFENRVRNDGRLPLRHNYATPPP